MPDRTDDRRAARRHGTQQCFVGEGQQILDAATTARDHDDVDERVGVENLHRPDDFGDCVRTLDGDLLDPELHRGPSPSRIVEHIAFGGRLAPADQSDGAGQERKGSFAFCGEQPFGGKQLLQPLDPGEQLADADRADLERVQLQHAARYVELRLCPDHHPAAFGETLGERVDELAGGRHTQGDVGRGIAQHEEDRVRPGPTGDLGELAVDPDAPEATHPLADRLCDGPDRNRRFRRRFESHTGERR